MKGALQNRKVSKVGTILSIAWFIVYAGGGAVGFAEFAAANPSHVPRYMPVVIFAWVAGFFVGHALFERLCLRLSELKFKKAKLASIEPRVFVSSTRTEASNLPELTDVLTKSAYVITEIGPILLQENVGNRIIKFYLKDLKRRPNRNNNEVEKNDLSPHSRFAKTINICKERPSSINEELIYA